MVRYSSSSSCREGVEWGERGMVSMEEGEGEGQRTGGDGGEGKEKGEYVVEGREEG